MASPQLSGQKDALQWWQEHVTRKEYVLARQEHPEGRGRRWLLRTGHAVEVAGGQVWILTTPDMEDHTELCRRNYWAVVEALLANYEPAVLERESAVRLYLDDRTPPEQLRIRQASNESRYKIEICEGLHVQIVAGAVPGDRCLSVDVNGSTLRVDRPEHTLLTMRLRTLRAHLEEVTIWLQGLVVSNPALQEEWAEDAHPVLLKRMAEIARQAGNERLHKQLTEFLDRESKARVSKARSGVGSEIVVPARVTDARASTPWLTRHAVRCRRWEEQVRQEVVSRAADLPVYGLETLLEWAQQEKTYDAYHSTTIEGYRITPEAVQAVIEGRPFGGHEPEEVRARAAVEGYSVAFERCMETARSSHGGLRLDQKLVLDLHADLFSPSVEAGIVDPGALRGWRNQPAYIRGTRYVPPAPGKLSDLMHQYFDRVSEESGDPIVRAALGHVDFVAIHPFRDGNGRTARFLMNLVLMDAGLPWTTIRTDDRIAYFKALDAATTEDDAGAFGTFILEYVIRALERLTRAGL